jgi:phosphoglycerate dehydrogenase-like enzyme
MADIQVLSVKALEPKHLDKLRHVSPRLHVSQKTCDDPGAIANLVKDVDILYTYHAGFSLGAASRLKWVQLSSTGVNHLLGKPIMDSSIPVTTTRGIHATPIAEFVFGSLLSVGRHLDEMQRDQQAHRWQNLSYWEKKGGLELRGRTIGIVGYGAIGSEIGRLAAAFGMEVLAVRRHPDQQRPTPGGLLPGTGDLTGNIPKRVWGPAALHDMLPACDVVVLTVPLTSETVGLIGPEEISAMKRSAYLINVARGSVVDEPALLGALQTGQLMGAVLDTFQEEPLPVDSPFWDLPNVLVTPHVAPNSSHYNDRASDVFAENLRRFLTGEPMLNEFDRARGY